jgi:phage baseplate assembly protein W
MTTRYIGLNADTGAQISDLDHIRQSISKIPATSSAPASCAETSAA